MERVLHVIGAMDMGGTETVLMNLYRRVDRMRYQFDFVVHTPRDCAYEQEIRDLGGRVFRAEKYLVRNYASYSRWWREFLKAHPEHRIVHCHQGSVAPVCLREANKAGRVTIAHSHATRNPVISLHSIAWNANSWSTRFISKEFLACSREAGLDRFGEGVINSPKFHIMKNGIDISRFTFSQVARKRFRKDLRLDGSCLAVGHVGRFSPEKNHEFLISVFAELVKRKSNSVLLLLGQGANEKQIRNQVSRAGLDGLVKFLGVRSNVEDYYYAMDALCFPSLYEGLGMVAVEAQASGLPVIASDTLPEIADTGSGLLERRSLDDAPGEWAEALLAHAGERRDAGAARYVRAAGYDIADVAEWLQGYYDGLLIATSL